MPRTEYDRLTREELSEMYEDIDRQAKSLLTIIHTMERNGSESLLTKNCDVGERSVVGFTKFVGAAHLCYNDRKNLEQASKDGKLTMRKRKNDS